MRGSWKISVLAALLLAALPLSAATARVIDGVVAVVGDEPITFSEVRDAAAEGLGIPPGDADLYLREETEPRRILHWIEMLVESTLVRKELAKTGLAIPEADVDRAVESVRRTNKMSEADFSEALARDGISLEGYKRRIRWQMERGAIVRDRKLREVTVTDEEVKEWFRENSDRFLEGAEARISTLHLPLPPEEAGGDRLVRLRIAVQQAAGYLASGRTFQETAELLSRSFPGASVVSTDFVKEDDLLPEIRKEIRKLRTGEVSAPFFAESGAYIVRVLERRGGTLPEFATLKNALREELADRRSEKAFADILGELKTASLIDIRL